MIKQQYRARAGKKLWGFDIWIRLPNGERERKRYYGFETREEAEEALGALRARIKQAKHGIAPPASAPKLSDLIKKRLATIHRKNEHSRELRVLVTWLALLDPSVDAKERDLGKVQSRFPIINIGTPELRLYVEAREKQGVSNATIRRDLVIIAATIHQAAEFFPELAQWRTPKIPYPKVRKSRRERVIQADEYKKLLEYLQRPPDQADGTREQYRKSSYKARLRVAHILQFAMLTAMRHSEIMQLKWTDVDWAKNRLLVYQSKTDTYKQIPITEPLRKVLNERGMAKHSKEYIFSKGGNIYPKFYRIFREACEACGIPYGKDTPGGIVLHSARHTVTTQLVASGLDFDTVGQITGHSARELIAHYTHHSPASMARAAAALESVGSVIGEEEGDK